VGGAQRVSDGHEFHSTGQCRITLGACKLRRRRYISQSTQSITARPRLGCVMTADNHYYGIRREDICSIVRDLARYRGSNRLYRMVGFADYHPTLYAAACSHAPGIERSNMTFMTLVHTKYVNPAPDYGSMPRKNSVKARQSKTIFDETVLFPF